MTRAAWKKDSWRHFKAQQQPHYRDHEKCDAVLRRIALLPPIVSPGEIENLKSQVAAASEGKTFILQGGDCAERFIDCNEKAITDKIKILLQMSVILTYGARRPVVRLGRIAGQYAKPRSGDFEAVAGEKLPVYRGDSVNAFDPVPEMREPDPDRLLQAYHSSVATLNYIRAMIKGGFADLHHPLAWDLEGFRNTPQWERYREMAGRILDAINFMESFGGLKNESLGSVDFFISHEGLLLPYEEALTRFDPSREKDYNMGAHFLWIGDRTRTLDGAHVEYFRGIANPVGIKAGPNIKADDLIRLAETINPGAEKGRLTIITRMGAKKVEEKLPPLLRAVKRAGVPVTWSCDPMHGNIIRAGERKTRDFSSIMKELHSAAEIHQAEGTTLGGVHFELTGDNVTECVGGAALLTDDDLDLNYQSYCDPRLNYSQSLEMAFLIADFLVRNRHNEE